MKALIVGTGPSLGPMLPQLRRFDGLIFCCNNTPADLIAAGCDPRRMVWLACDPAWHACYSPVEGWFHKWHWSTDICERYGYSYVEGVWHEGRDGPTRLWLEDPTKITLGHCSSVQLLNLALNQYAAEAAVLVGHDFHYDGPQRHYFDGLSDVPGEYPAALRKHSAFDKGGRQYDLLTVYRDISETPDCPPILNATPCSRLPWFPFADLEDFLESRQPRRAPAARPAA